MSDELKAAAERLQSNDIEYWFAIDKLPDAATDARILARHYLATEAEDEELRRLVERLQWAGTAHGFGGQTAPRCPICTGMNPKFSLNVGGGNYHQGKGHAADCPVAKALGIELKEPE